MSEYTVEAYREGGQWKFKLKLPAWIIDDVLRDSTNLERQIISLEEEVQVGIYRQFGTRDKRTPIFVSVQFEEIKSE